MKKIFTLLAVCLLAVSANAAITIYVQSETAPFIWWWGLPEGQNAKDLAQWPGTFQFTQKKTITVQDQEMDFWYYSFDESVTSISFLFNNGESVDTKQTKDLNGVTDDRYYVWDGATELEDITSIVTGKEDPDAVITAVGLAGNHNGWGNDPFDVVEEGKVYKTTVDLSETSVEDNLWKFKFRPNGYWVGYSAVVLDEAPAWLGQAESDDNFQIDLEATELRAFTLTVTWGGGKAAEENWTFNAIGGSTGINSVMAVTKSNAAAIYNLQGQRVAANYQGIAIQNGKKVVLK